MDIKLRDLLFAAKYMRQYIYLDEHREKAHKGITEAIDKFKNEEVEFGIITIKSNLIDVLKEDPSDLGTSEILKALDIVFDFWLSHHKEL